MTYSVINKTYLDDNLVLLIRYYFKIYAIRYFKAFINGLLTSVSYEV